MIHLHAGPVINTLPPIVDPDPLLSCDLMDGRDAFLTLARDKHWEFSSLRRSKWSTLCMLVELHTQGQDRFVYTCNECKHHVETRWHCTVCEVSAPRLRMCCLGLVVDFFQGEKDQMRKAYLCTSPSLVLRLFWVYTRGLDVEGFLPCARATVPSGFSLGPSPGHMSWSGGQSVSFSQRLCLCRPFQGEETLTGHHVILFSILLAPAQCLGHKQASWRRAGTQTGEHSGSWLHLR